MRPYLPLALFVLPQAVLAHPGHLTDLAGHDHWVAGAAIGAAVLAGLWGVLKGRKTDAKAETDAEDASPEAEDDTEVPA